MNGRLSKEARALDSTRWDPCQYLTAAQERWLAARFRLHVMNLPPGSLKGTHRGRRQTGANDTKATSA